LVGIAIEANTDFDGQKSSARFSASWSLAVIRNTSLDLIRQVHLRADLKAVGDNPLPYSGHIQGMAEILFQRQEDADLLDQSAAWNAVSPLVGFVRTHLDGITAIGPHPRLLIGPVNIQKLLSGAAKFDGAGEHVALFPDDISAGAVDVHESFSAGTKRKIGKKKPSGL